MNLMSIPCGESKVSLYHALSLLCILYDILCHQRDVLLGFNQRFLTFSWTMDHFGNLVNPMDPF